MGLPRIPVRIPLALVLAGAHFAFGIPVPTTSQAHAQTEGSVTVDLGALEGDRRGEAATVSATAFGPRQLLMPGKRTPVSQFYPPPGVKMRPLPMPAAVAEKRSRFRPAMSPAPAKPVVAEGTVPSPMPMAEPKEAARPRPAPLTTSTETAQTSAKPPSADPEPRTSAGAQPAAPSVDESPAAASPAAEKPPKEAAPAAPVPPVEPPSPPRPASVPMAPPPLPPAAATAELAGDPTPAESEPVVVASVPAATGPITPGRAVRVVFAPSDSKLPDAAKPDLTDLAARVKDADQVHLQLVAYAGGEGMSPNKARRMSLSRALSVRSFLIENGVRSTRIEVRALGNKTEDEPVNRVDVNVAVR